MSDEQILEQINSTHVQYCNQQIVDIEYDERLKKLFETPTEITEVLKFLIFPKDAPQSLFCSVTNTTVDIDLLKNKNIYLFISTLDITDEELSVVRSVCDYSKTNEQYKIVWIPMVEEWNEQLRKKFDSLKSEIPWYVVQNFEIVRGYKYIQDDWNFKKKPILVVLSREGKIQSTHAFELIQAFGIKAFPFSFLKEELIFPKGTFTCYSNFNLRRSNLVKEDKYIFYYGGNDKEWVQQFTKYATTLANNATIKKEQISIELIYMEKEDKSVKNQFWNGIESLFVTKGHKKVDIVTQEVQKMLKYKNETGWALLSKGSSLVLSGHGTTILKTVAEFEQWKHMLVESGSFELSFKEYHKNMNTIHHCTHSVFPIVAGKLTETIKCPNCPNTEEFFITYKNFHGRCTHFRFPIVAGKLPETINCPDCPNSMEIFISYKCFHNKNTTTNAKSCTDLEIPIVAGELPETIKCPDCPNTMEINFISYKCFHHKNTTANAKN